MKTKRQILKELNGEDKALRWIHMVAIGLFIILLVAILLALAKTKIEIVHHPFIQLLFTFVILSVFSYIYLKWKFK